MLTDGRKGSWVQCINCGKIHYIPQSTPIDELYIVTDCPCCGTEKHINLGDQKEDWYLYYDVTLDSRYYVNNTKLMHKGD